MKSVVKLRASDLRRIVVSEVRRIRESSEVEDVPRTRVDAALDAGAAFKKSLADAMDTMRQYGMTDLVTELDEMSDRLEKELSLLQGFSEDLFGQDMVEDPEYRHMP